MHLAVAIYVAGLGANLGAVRISVIAVTAVEDPGT